MAIMLKKAERREPIDVKFAERIAQARNGPVLKTAIVMDNKIIRLELPWEIIASHTEHSLTEWIMKQMREEITQ